MVELEMIAGGVLLPVQVQPRARRNAVVGEHAGRLKVAVTQAPEKGKANDAVVQVLADALDLRKSQIQLTAGATSPRKTFRISGADADELRKRLSAALVPERR